MTKISLGVSNMLWASSASLYEKYTSKRDRYRKLGKYTIKELQNVECAMKEKKIIG